VAVIGGSSGRAALHRIARLVDVESFAPLLQKGSSYDPVYGSRQL
jgi:hypothetical protein